MSVQIIDTHAHCGIQDQGQSFEDYSECIKDSGITGVAMFPPVIEIYNRYHPSFEDNLRWQERRKAANEYLLTLGNDALEVFPYFFIWNDFAAEQFTPRHHGIKWHRHAGEPIYHYDDPRCGKAIEEIRRRNLAVVLEEELENTVRFIREIAERVRVIIPHLGFLNGGYNSIGWLGLWENPNVYTDTALASSNEIANYIRTYGHERIMFGSDFPFGDPKSELEKVLSLKISSKVKDEIISLNVKRLWAENVV